jgi:hypothetical protein
MPNNRGFHDFFVEKIMKTYKRNRLLGDAGAGGASPAAHPVKGEWVPLNRGQVEELAASITDTLAGLGFYRHPGRELQTRFLRDLISRAGLSGREGKYLADIFAKAARLGARSCSDKNR